MKEIKTVSCSDCRIDWIGYCPLCKKHGEKSKKKRPYDVLRPFGSRGGKKEIRHHYTPTPEQGYYENYESKRKKYKSQKKKLLTKNRKQQHYKCIYCECGLTIKQVTVDHMVPRSKGGSNDRKNLLPACATCNGDKGNLSLKDFLHKEQSWIKNNPIANQKAMAFHKKRIKNLKKLIIQQENSI